MIEPRTLEQCASLAEELAANPAEAVHQLPLLRKWLRDLPPPRAQLLSRPEWNVASLWTNVAAFENVQVNEERIEIVRCQRDLWLRGCVATVIPAFQPGEDPTSLEELITQVVSARSIINFSSRQFRQLFEMSLRLDGDLGFFSRGQSGEVMIGAEGATGTCERAAKMDWALTTNQHIEVRIRNNSLWIGGSLLDFGGIPIRAIFVAFWGVEQRGGYGMMQGGREPLLGGGSLGERP